MIRSLLTLLLLLSFTAPTLAQDVELAYTGDLSSDLISTIVDLQGWDDDTETTQFIALPQPLPRAVAESPQVPQFFAGTSHWREQASRAPPRQ